MFYCSLPLGHNVMAWRKQGYIIKYIHSHWSTQKINKGFPLSLPSLWLCLSLNGVIIISRDTCITQPFHSSMSSNATRHSVWLPRGCLLCFHVPKNKSGQNNTHSIKRPISMTLTIQTATSRTHWGRYMWRGGRTLVTAKYLMKSK